MIREVDRIQARRKHPWPPNVHRTPYGRYLGRFNLFGTRWYTGCYGSVGEAEQAVALMRRWLAAMAAQGWAPSSLRQVEVEAVVLKGRDWGAATDDGD